MIVHPAVIALLTGSFLVTGMIIYAGAFSIRILRNWDLHSGSEEQLMLERRTYLVSTLLACALALQLVSLFFFVAIVENLSTLISGAMCAAGVLNANRFGYPALLLKVAGFFLSGFWLVMNHLDTRCFDYPLIRRKYALLLLTAPVFVAESVLLVLFFSRLEVTVITSCCGSLFSEQGARLAADLATLPFTPVMALFIALGALVLVMGLVALRTGKGGGIFGMLSFLLFPVSMAALISAISPYFYELPTHHCPFCLLKPEYFYLGYLLHGSLLGGGLAGAGASLVSLPGQGSTLAKVRIPMQRRLIVTSLSCYLFFAVIVVVRVLTTDFRF